MFASDKLDCTCTANGDVSAESAEAPVFPHAVGAAEDTISTRIIINHYVGRVTQNILNTYIFLSLSSCPAISS